MKAHRTDAVSLVFALIFLAAAAWWLLAQIMDLSLPAVGWFVAGALILIGIGGLFGALRAGRSGAPAADPTSDLTTSPISGPPTDPDVVSGGSPVRDGTERSGQD